MNQIHYGMTMEDYRNARGVSKSLLDKFAHTPLTAQRYLSATEPSEPTDAMVFGTLLDAAVFEPANLLQLCVVRPDQYPGDDETFKPWNANARYCRIWAGQHKGVHIVTSERLREINSLASAVRSHPAAAKVLNSVDGKAQVSVFADDKRTGLQLKGRPDWVGNRYAADLKLMRDASDAGVLRAIRDYRLHVQAAFYTDLLEANGVECNSFYLVCVENHDLGPLVNVVLLSQRMIEDGRQTYRRDLERYSECKHSNQWPGYCGAEPNTIDFPDWHYNRGEVNLTIGGQNVAL